jgi:hypothetical protein
MDPPVSVLRSSEGRNVAIITKITTNARSGP